jgi:hypothetical protein
MNSSNEDVSCKMKQRKGPAEDDHPPLHSLPGLCTANTHEPSDQLNRTGLVAVEPVTERNNWCSNRWRKFITISINSGVFTPTRF